MIFIHVNNIWNYSQMFFFNIIKIHEFSRKKKGIDCEHLFYMSPGGHISCVCGWTWNLAWPGLYFWPSNGGHACAFRLCHKRRRSRLNFNTDTPTINIKKINHLQKSNISNWITYSLSSPLALLHGTLREPNLGFLCNSKIESQFLSLLPQNPS